MTTSAAIPVVAVGVCGSDVQRYRNGFAVSSLGHELVGRRPTDGVLVAIRPLSPCRTCAVCRRGWTEQCADDTGIGRRDNGEGGFSGQVRVRADQLYPLPARLSATVATLADPLACLMHALRGTGISDADVLVIGDGPMAAIACVYARRRGARQVTVAVKEADRIERFSDFGDRVVTAGDLLADHYDVVVESVGGASSEPILTAVTAVAPLGQIVALGVYRPDATAELPVRGLLEKESTLRGSKAYRVSDSHDDFATALALLATAPDAFASVITSTSTWSPDDPQPSVFERRHVLKTVYMNEPHATGDARH
jgi:threonine dehydrogenase-like Zn-dependent dehydrogenase